MTSSSVLVRRAAECKGGDAYLGGGMSLAECEAACARAPACRYFIWGTETGVKRRQCYHEFTASDECPEGWEPDSFNFYRLVTWRLVGAVQLRRNVECRSSDVHLGTFPGRVDECAAACAGRRGCRYFIFGTGAKAGSCWQEFTDGAECPEGWQADQYDFYELEDAAPPSPSPSLAPPGAAASSTCPPRAAADGDRSAFLSGFVAALALVVALLVARRALPRFAASRSAAGSTMGSKRVPPVSAGEDAGQLLLVSAAGRPPPSDAAAWTCGT